MSLIFNRFYTQIIVWKTKNNSKLDALAKCVLKQEKRHQETKEKTSKKK